MGSCLSWLHSQVQAGESRYRREETPVTWQCFDKLGTNGKRFASPRNAFSTSPSPFTLSLSKCMRLMRFSAADSDGEFRREMRPLRWAATLPGLLPIA